MNIQEVSLYVFFIAAGLLFYTYIGYGVMASVVGMLRKRRTYDLTECFTVPLTIIIPAYNEKLVLDEKIKNTYVSLHYFNTSQVILVTEGSTDGSNDLLFSQTNLLHIKGGERKGKSAAINTAMEHAMGEIVIITDANAMVNTEAFEKLVARFKNKKSGAVSGEKKVITSDGSTGGEGLYWKYESFLKRKSARMYSLTGAAGELLAFRKSLFKPIPADAILDDMVLSLNIIRQGRTIDYEPNAYAVEPPSKSITEEFKRKVRISAGVWQTLCRNLFVFNPFKHSIFVFQFGSHRVLRWICGISCTALALLANFFLLGPPNVSTETLIFDIVFGLQCIFYFFVLIGYLLRNNKNLPAFVFLPFYFTMMNIAVMVGFFKYLNGSESVLWEKADR